MPRAGSLPAARGGRWEACYRAGLLGARLCGAALGYGEVRRIAELPVLAACGSLDLGRAGLSAAGLAGIYPAFDLRSYPGLARAAPAYGLGGKQLAARLGELNPIGRAGALAKARVPALLIHGDEDRVVPLRQNSQEFAARYRAAGAEKAVRLIVAKAVEGHYGGA